MTRLRGLSIPRRRPRCYLPPIVRQAVTACCPVELLHARLVRGILWSLAGAIAARGITLLASAAAARMLGAVHFGELGIVQTTSSFFAAVAGLGLGITITAHVAQHLHAAPARAARGVALSLVASALGGLTMAVLLFVAAPALSGGMLEAPHLTSALRLSGGLLLFGVLGGAQTGALAGIEAFSAVAVLNGIRGLLGGLFLIAGVYADGILGGVLGLVFAEAIGVAAGFYLLHSHFASRGMSLVLRGAGEEAPLIWHRALPALLGSLTTMLALWLTKVWLVQSNNGYAEAGLYDAAQRWALLILFLPAAIAPVQLPMLTRLQAAGNDAAYARLLRINIALTATICAVPAGLMALMSTQLMRGFGLEFASGSPVLAVAALGAVAVALNTALGQALVSSNMMWWRFSFDGFLAACMIIAGWWLIPRYGAGGLAWASTIAYAATCGGLASCLRVPAFAGGRATLETVPSSSLQRSTGGEV